LKIRKVEGYQNYDKSEFESAAPLSTDDDKLEKIWQNQHSLKTMTADSEFKSFEDLKSRLDKVLGLNGEVPMVRTTVEQAKAAPRKPTPEPELVTTEEEDDLSYFSKLANDDA
jgi:hypothetical protein